MIVTPAEMRAVEDAAFASGNTAESLMDAVGQRIADRILSLLDERPAVVVFYAGKGNNAGDVLVAAAALTAAVATDARKVKIVLRLAVEDPSQLSDLPRRKLAALPGSIERASEQRWLGSQRLPQNRIAVDGLLGIGAKGTLREPIKTFCREINSLRRAHAAYVIAVDVPTGLDAETGRADEDAVVADETIAVGFAKTGLVTDGAADHVGKLNVLALPEFGQAERSAPAAAGRGAVIAADNLNNLLPPRPHESNKGMYGRVGIVAGSVGATGAAVMCAHACARAGAGLITLLTHPDIYPIIAAAASPEVMVKPLPRLLDVLDMNFDVLGLGPGLGREHDDEVRQLIARWPKQMVVDADGLNALSDDMNILTAPAGPRLLTPHPGEMARLLAGSTRLSEIPGHEKTSRVEAARLFTERFPVTLLLKGARTLVAEAGLPLAYNSTGNAGMATGGMGDVLTGICCALAGQELGLYDAARLGAWLHGQAGDLARAGGESEQSLLPCDLMIHLGRAFACLRD